MSKKDTLYCSGIALIMEGDTEKYFYEEVLNRICEDNDIQLTKEEDNDELSDFFILSKKEKKIVLKMKNAETITQITNQYLWFKNYCIEKFNNIWHVVLCYDTDGNNYSAFTNDDWKTLRNNISKHKNVKTILDCTADRDIEDLFLIDLEGVLLFLGIDNLVKLEDLRGRKGKVKMKNLYTDYTELTYHEGKRALPLIKSLNIRKIINHSNNNINKLEEIIVDIFKETN